MAAGWVKSLQCKSRAYEDVYHPHPKQLLLTSTSCRNSYQNLKDVVNADQSKPKPKPIPKPKPPRPDPFSSKVKRCHSEKPKLKKKRVGEETRSSTSTSTSSSQAANRVRRTLSAPIGKGSGVGVGAGTGSGHLGVGVGVGVGPFFPSVAELAEGHPSRNVVEIIFHTRWGPKGFTGRVDMVFKVQTSARASARFEEYRDSVMLRAGPGSGARCVADGNEMMRFQCRGPTNAAESFVNGCDGTTTTTSAAASICTYSGSGAAHESASGGKGRRAMVVCRVIAGRVSKRAGSSDPVVGSKSGDLVEFDSVSGENGELLVFDSRAVLPCFLVIYKL